MTVTVTVTHLIIFLGAELDERGVHLLVDGATHRDGGERDGEGLNENPGDRFGGADARGCWRMLMLMLGGGVEGEKEEEDSKWNEMITVRGTRVCLRLYVHTQYTVYSTGTLCIIAVECIIIYY